jgi:hypothetical protein
MNIYDILFNFSSGEVLKLKIKDIENLLSLFESLEKENYKYIDDE